MQITRPEASVHCLLFPSQEAWGKRKLPCRSTSSPHNSSVYYPCHSSKHGHVDVGWNRCLYEPRCNVGLFLCVVRYLNVLVTEPSACERKNSFMCLGLHVKIIHLGAKWDFYSESIHSIHPFIHSAVVVFLSNKPWHWRWLFPPPGWRTKHI